MIASVPMTPGLAIAFVISMTGIALLLFSRNASIKRVALPVMLVAFHWMVFVVIRRSGALLGVPTIGLIALLAANAYYVFRVVRFCPTCGRTFQGSLRGDTDIRCAACSAV
jgi:LSD1 subclass zinc finger protein